MRTVVLMSALLAFSTVHSLAAQDTGSNRPRADLLRQRIEERFTARVQEELGLSDDQTTKLRSTAREYAGRRRELEAQERDLRSALAAQLRPGVAADQDRVADLTSKLVDLRVAYAQSFRDEMREHSKYLTPVQRAQLYVMRERLLQRIQEVRDRREEAGGPRAGRRRPFMDR
jgi:Spy/CpxP family protein refolding chaperone